MRGRLRRVVPWLCTLLFLAIAPLHAQSLAPVQDGQLPALETTKPLRAIALVDGQPLAMADDEAWRLDDARKAWRHLSSPTGVAVAPDGIVEGGTQAWVLTTAPGAREVTGVARLRLRGDTLQWQRLPALPEPLHDARGAWANDTLSVAGLGTDGTARLLQLRTNTEQPQWSKVGGWPGGGAPTSLVAQSAAVFVTVADAAGAAERLLRWNADTGWSERGRVPGRVLPGSGHALGQANAIYLVGDAGAAHPMTFQVITSAWATLPGLAPAGVVATGAWTDGMFWAQRDAAGQRIDFGYARVQSTKLLLRWLDWVVIVVYLAAMVGIGLFFYLREKRNSTAGFFVGGRSILRSGPRASACTPPTPARSASSRSRPRRSRPTGNTSPTT